MESNRYVMEGGPGGELFVFEQRVNIINRQIFESALQEVYLTGWEDVTTKYRRDKALVPHPTTRTWIIWFPYGLTDEENALVMRAAELASNK